MNSNTNYLILSNNFIHNNQQQTHNGHSAPMPSYSAPFQPPTIDALFCIFASNRNAAFPSYALTYEQMMQVGQYIDNFFPFKLIYHYSNMGKHFKYNNALAQASNIIHASLSLNLVTQQIYLELASTALGIMNGNVSTKYLAEVQRLGRLCGYDLAQLGELFLQNSDAGNAVTYFKLAIIVNPDSSSTHVRFARVYKQLNKFDLAKEELLKAKSICEGYISHNISVNAFQAVLSQVNNELQELNAALPSTSSEGTMSDCSLYVALHNNTDYNQVIQNQNNQNLNIGPRILSPNQADINNVTPITANSLIKPIPRYPTKGITLTITDKEGNNAAKNNVSNSSNKRLIFVSPIVAAPNTVSASYQTALLSNTLVLTNDTSKAQINNNINRITNTQTVFSMQTDNSRSK